MRFSARVLRWRAIAPAPRSASLGAGRKDALPAIIGGLFGALAYSLVYETIEPWLIQPLNFGRHSLADALGVNPTALGIGFAVLLAGGVFLIDRWERLAGRSQPVEMTGARSTAGGDGRRPHEKSTAGAHPAVGRPFVRVAPKGPRTRAGVGHCSAGWRLCSHKWSYSRMTSKVRSTTRR